MVDKSVIQQVLGCLMKHPHYFSEVDKYCLTVTDFSSRFERYIFLAILGLYKQGAVNITPLDIDNFLSTDECASRVFEQYKGIEYLQDIEEFCQAENFPYYYNKLKKLNLLRDLKKQGFDITEFYMEDLTNPKALEINSNFENLTIQDICTGVKSKLLLLESNYAKTDEVEVEKASQGMKNFLEEINEKIEIGPSLQGHIYNKIIGGACKGALTIRSGSSGLGKALPNSTLLPTPNGWKTVEEIKVGDYLFDALGKPTKVLQVFPQGRKEVWEVLFKDGRTARCCDEHLWNFYYSQQIPSDLEERKMQTKTLKEILKEPLFSCVYGTMIPNVLVPQQHPVCYSTKHHTISPYKYGLTFESEGCSLSREYVEDSIDNRCALLAGLIDANGYIDEGVLFYTGTNINLMKSVEEVARSLGLYTKIDDSDIYLIVLTLEGSQEIERKILENSCNYELYEDWAKNKQKRNPYKYLYNPIIDIRMLGYKEEMTCFYVDNEEHLFLTEEFIVTHNTRQAMADACQLAYPVRYNYQKGEWEQNGSSEKVLFIVTEQTFPQIRKMILAYLSDINESRFKLGHFTNEELSILNQAIEVMETYADNMIFVKMPNPTIELVKTIVRENCLTKNINHVFYDYIFIGPALLGEFRGFNLRNDKLLSYI